jgi:hypothetical protein
VNRILLAIWLSMTQLLVGSGAAAYLCVSDGGGVCCIDRGPAGCTCCQHEEPAHHRHDSDACSKHEHEQQHDGQQIADPDRCGCRHVLISSQQPSSISRLASEKVAERISQLVASLPMLVSIDAIDLAISPREPCYGPPPVPDLGLVSLSTVIIRC